MGIKEQLLWLCILCLGLNNYLLEVPEPEVVTMMEKLASGEENQESLGKWLAENYIDI